MKFSVSMYSYMQKIRSGEATPFELIAKTKELGFDAIEFVDFTDFGTGTKEERLAHAEELRKECERVGLEISALVMSCDFITGSDGDLDKEIARVKDYVDIAHVLGVTRMRHDAAIGYARNSGDFCPFDTMLPRLTKACKEITEYAAQFGIRTMVENHGFYVQDSERVEKLYAAVDNKNFGLLTDMGNFLCADEDPASAFARVAPYAYYVHAKDDHADGRPCRHDRAAVAFRLIAFLHDIRRQHGIIQHIYKQRNIKDEHKIRDKLRKNRSSRRIKPIQRDIRKKHC